MSEPTLYRTAPSGQAAHTSRLVAEIEAFREFGAATRVELLRCPGSGRPVSVYTNEFWTARQRQGHPLHEVSYRACFKPQLPRFFIDRLSAEGDRVYDPFMGRGTTPLEAALAGRVPMGNDVNPLARILLEPRLDPPALEEIGARLAEIPLRTRRKCPEELLVFYHPDTLREIVALRHYLLEREVGGGLDRTDRWIRMIAVNRLTGHSPGFFSVYTMPPNQAVSVDAQRKINERRRQTPPYRAVAELILKKSRSLLGKLDAQTRQRLSPVAGDRVLLCGPASQTPEIAGNSVTLVVTSPPFLDVVDYAAANWLRCWFCGIDADRLQIGLHRTPAKWQEMVANVFTELRRILRPGGHVAFEVGEVRGGKVRLEEAVLECAEQAGLEPVLVLINAQQFTKTANCWGVTNNRKGTNTNRIVLLRKAG